MKGEGDRAHDFKKNVNHINTKSYIIKKKPCSTPLLLYTFNDFNGDAWIIEA